MGKLCSLIKAHPKSTLTLFLVVGLAVLIAVAALWEPAESQADRAVNDTLESLERAEPDTALEHVALDYYHDGVTRRWLGDLAANAIKTYGAPRIRVMKRKTEVSGTLATCWLDILSSTRKRRSGLTNMARSLWQVSLHEREGGWYIHKIVPISANAKPVGTLPALARHLNLWVGPY